VEWKDGEMKGRRLELEVAAAVCGESAKAEESNSREEEGDIEEYRGVGD
jgi:hypothetical protein